MRNIQLALLCVALACVLCTATVSATSFAGVEYETNIYGVTSDFKFTQPPAGAPDVKELKEAPEYKMAIPGQNDERIVRYPLVGLIGKQVTVVLRGFETSKPVTYETDLENVQITLNGEPIPTGEPIPAERGTLRVSGTISSSEGVGNKIRTIEFNDLGEEENNRLVVYTGALDMLQAAETIYKTYEAYEAKKSTGNAVLPEHFADAVAAYQSGNYELVMTNLQFAEQEAASYDRGHQDGLILGVGATVILLGALMAIAIHLRSKSVARAKKEQYYRPHLCDLNTVVMRYYERKEKNEPIPAKYEAVLKRAFEYEPNASKDIARYKPSLFQALYMMQRADKYEKVPADEIRRVYETAINKLIEGLPASDAGEKQAGGAEKNSAGQAESAPGFVSGLFGRIKRTNTGR